MATSAEGTATGLLNLERELVCFICTEILYQPLSLIDCLHSFCGSCLKIWFSHQHRKAVSSSTTPTSSPYTCPTCRATVYDARPNAMINTYVDMFITANPTRARAQEDKDEISAMYKPGENILPRVETGRRRERRTRRDDEEARERRMIEEARERSLLDIHGPSASHQSHLRPPAPSQQQHSSRSRDREREERRERRREQARQEQRLRAQTTEDNVMQSHVNVPRPERRETAFASPPASSLRHPEAVEARQRQQTVAHQASLVSLISSSEGSTGSGTGDSLIKTRIMQEILADGLLDGIDVDSLTEAESDVWAERIAEAYRQRLAASEQDRAIPDPGRDRQNSGGGRDSNGLQSESSGQARHGRSSSRQRRAETLPVNNQDNSVDNRSQALQNQPSGPSSNLLPPPSTIAHRRRHSNQSQSSVTIRSRSGHSSPPVQSSSTTSRVATDSAHVNRSREDDAQQQTVSRAGIERVGASSRDPTSGLDVFSPGTTPATPPQTSNGSALTAITTPPSIQLAEHPITESSSQRSDASTLSQANRPLSQGSVQFEEPSVSCFRCHRADIQYEVYRHCLRCNVDLCTRCYRAARGCNHWYGFGHSAMVKFESSTADRRDTEAVELPHMLVARSTKKPDQALITTSKLAKDGVTVIPLTTRSDPASRFSEGHFCDRCGAFANSCFWSCDYCNEGEWGFCRDCVNTHHCCTHPLLPIAHRSSLPPSQLQQFLRESNNTTVELTPSELHAAHLRPSPIPSQPGSATSAVSISAGPLPGYINLNITTHCDECSQPIPPAVIRYHCPFHPTPTATNPKASGDYDICTTCYHNLVKTNRIKRDDGPAGWRKCPSNHRMIITVFEPDADGGNRRTVLNDLVGGWKMTENDMSAWMVAMTQRRDYQPGTTSPINVVANPLLDNVQNPRGAWTWREDQNSSRRATRARTLTLSPVSSPHPGNATLSNQPPSSPTSSSIFFKFPPDGGFGSKATALWSYYPEEGDEGRGELMFPRWAELREVEDINGEWWDGIYAGDVGVGPSNYVRF